MFLFRMKNQTRLQGIQLILEIKRIWDISQYNACHVYELQPRTPVQYYVHLHANFTTKSTPKPSLLEIAEICVIADSYFYPFLASLCCLSLCKNLKGKILGAGTCLFAYVALEKALMALY